MFMIYYFYFNKKGGDEGVPVVVAAGAGDASIAAAASRHQAPIPRSSGRPPLHAHGGGGVRGKRFGRFRQGRQLGPARKFGKFDINKGVFSVYSQYACSVLTMWAIPKGILQMKSNKLK
eukprot:1884350-Pyramimonas_sp.AAC.1